MVVPLLFFVTSLAVKQDQTPLRSGCEAEETTVATLAAGTPVEIRFRLADGSDCIKVAATVDGKTLVGYVPGSALKGMDQFDQERSSAASVDIGRALTPVEAETKKVVIGTGDAALTQASALLDSGQPAKALEILEHALPRYRKNANVLLLAGLAAYRSDQLKGALDYWKQSLDLAPNEGLQRVYDKVRREAEADHSGEKLVGMHIALRYEGESLPADDARAIIALLDGEFTRISSQLGCSAGERIVAIVQSRDAYLRSTGAAEWSGGQYDGRIHISLSNGERVGPEMRRTLAHELVHACLTGIEQNGTRWPAWVQEGLAQKLSGDVLQPATRAQLKQMAGTHAIPRLEDLRQDWSRLNTDNARLSYALALAAADALYENYSGYGIRNVLNNPQTLAQITPELDKKLGFQ